MNDLSTRVRDYLDRKKPTRPLEVTPDVTSEVEPDEFDELDQAWSEFKDQFKTPILYLKIFLTICLVILCLWAMAIVDIQNDCYMNKECREWVKNR